MIAWLSPPAAERRVLSGAPLRSITPWIVAVMSFTILLTAACGLVTARAAAELRGSIGQRHVLTVPAGDPEMIASQLRRLPGVKSVEAVSEGQMRRSLKRWLGPTAERPDLPIPALVRFQLTESGDIARVHQTLLKAAPGGAVTSYEESIAPLLSSLRLIQVVALGLVVLLAAAAASAVVLAARGAIESHRSTVEILHGIGATDNQVARIFQHRIALDTLVGSLAGALAAGAVILAMSGGARWAADMSGLSLNGSDLLMLALLPLLLTIIATLPPRGAILSALRQSL